MEEAFIQLLREIRDDFLVRYQKDDVETSYDINNGFCEDFAIEVEKKFKARFPNSPSQPEMFWLDELADYDILKDDYAHCIVIFKVGDRERYYDAECLSGVDDWRQLPLVRNANAKKTRNQVLTERTFWATILQRMEESKK